MTRPWSTGGESLTNSTLQGVGARARTAAVWIAASMLLAHALTLVRSIVTARLLSPNDFGLFSMALTVVTALGALATVSLDHSIKAHAPGAGAKQLDAALDGTWTAELVRRLAITLLLAALVYPAARFYGRSELLLILPCAALVPLLQGFQNPGLAVLRNRISFARLFWHETTSAVFAAFISIGLAVTFRNVWSLVIGQLAGVAAGTAVSYFLHPHRPRLVFDSEVFRQALHFGKYATVIGVLAYITTTADNVLIGKLFGAEVLGVYAIAYGLASLAAGVVMGAVGRATFPAYAGLSERGLRRVAPAFCRSLAASAALLILVTVPLFLLAPEIVSVLYGPKWIAAGEVLRVLSLVALARGLVVIISWLHMGLGRPREAAAGKLLEAIVFLALLYPLTLRYGVMGAAYTGLAAYVAGLYNRVLSVRRLLPLAFGRTLRIIGVAAAAGVCGAAVGWLILQKVEGNLPRLAAGGVASTLVAAIILDRLMPGLRAEAKALLRTLRPRTRFSKPE